MYNEMVVLPEVDSTSHKSCTASARATARKILHRKHFASHKKKLCHKRNPKRDVSKSIILIDYHSLNCARLRYDTIIQNKVCTLRNK